MLTTEMKLETLQAAAGHLPDNEAIHMVNLLRYRSQADYGPGTDLPTCTGREAYFQRYVPAFHEIVAGRDIKPIWLGSVAHSLVVPDAERWDDIAIVVYPSYAVFRQVVESAAYKKQADPHRAAALEDWRLIATTAMPVPA